MQTKRKSNSVVTHQVIGDVIQYTIWGVYGEVDDAHPERNEVLTLDMRKLSDAVKARAAVHGLVQRVSDAAAMPWLEGQPKPSPRDKALRMRALVEHYESGTEEWALKGSAIGAGEGLLLQVLMRMRPQDGRDKLAAFVGKLRPMERTKLLNSDKLRPVADEIRAEMSAGIDADAMMAELDQEPGES